METSTNAAPPVPLPRLVERWVETAIRVQDTFGKIEHAFMASPENLVVLCLRCANRRDAKRRAVIRKTKRLAFQEHIQPSLPLVTSIITKL